MLGWKPTARAPAPMSDMPPIADITAEAVKLGFAVNRGKPEGPPPIVDLDEMREKNRLRKIEIARRNAAAR